MRLEVIHIAKDVDVSQTGVSFTAAINLIDTQLRWLTLHSGGVLSSKLKQMREHISYFILQVKRKDPSPLK